jgi:hypothetical protein
MDLEQQLGIKLSVLISGLIGGIVSLTYDTKISFARALLLILGGASTAAYLQPVAQHYLGLPEQFSTGLGFIMGLVSMKIIEFLIENTEKYLKSNLRPNGHSPTSDNKRDNNGD